MKLEIWKIGGVEFVSIISFARFVKVSPPSVYRWIYIGMPVCKSTMNTYLIPFREALDWVKDYRGKSW